MTRADALTRARLAGYHADTAAYTRVLTEARVRRAALDEAYMAGQQQRADGMRCECHQCRAAAARGVANG